MPAVAAALVLALHRIAQSTCVQVFQLMQAPPSSCAGLHIGMQGFAA